MSVSSLNSSKTYDYLYKFCNMEGIPQVVSFLRGVLEALEYLFIAPKDDGVDQHAAHDECDGAAEEWCNAAAAIHGRGAVGHACGGDRLKKREKDYRMSE